MTSFAILLTIAFSAFIAFVAYQAGRMDSDVRHERLRMKRRWKLDDLSYDVLREPFTGLYDLTATIRAYVGMGIADVIDRLVLAICTDRRRASRLHRRAQKAEGLLARREARDARRAERIAEALDIVDDKPEEAFVMVHDLLLALGEQDLALVFMSPWVSSRLDFEHEERKRAHEFHRRAQKAEGALRRLKMKLIKKRVGGVLSAEDFDAVAVMSHEERPAWVARRAEELGIAHLLEMPPIPLTGHWTRGDRPAFDVVPAAKPLSDVTPKRTVTAMPGLDLSDLTGPLKCHETLSTGDLNSRPVECTREAGHDGQHMGRMFDAEFKWGLAVKPDFSGGVLEAMSAAMNECTACGGMNTEACLCGKEPLRCVCHPCDCIAAMVKVGS